MFRSFVLRSLLVFVFSTSPFAAYALTPSAAGCGTELVSEDTSGYSEFGVVVSGALVIVDIFVGCLADTRFISKGDVYSHSLVVINNTKGPGGGIVSDGVFITVVESISLTSVHFGGVSMSPYSNVSVNDAYKIPNSSENMAFDDYLAWVYLGAPY